MAEAGSKRKAIESVDEIIAGVGRTKAKPEGATTDARFAKITANPFYKIMFEGKLSPKQKSEQYAKLMTFLGSKEEARARIEEHELFNDFLQLQREEMAKEIIKFTDTGAYSELNDTYKQMNEDFLAYEELMQPFTDTINAVYKLRKSGMSLEAFKNIIQDQRQETERKIELDKLTDDSVTKKLQRNALEEDIAALKTKKSWFGLGGVTTDAQEAIARLNVQQAALDDELTKITTRATELEAMNNQQENTDPEYLAQKDALRKFLDISSEEHKSKQEALVKAALDFVVNSKERIGSIRTHLTSMDKQLKGLGDGNNLMCEVYSIMLDGSEIAEKENLKIRETLDKAKENESAVERMARESTRQVVDQHITAVKGTAMGIAQTEADLTSQRVRIKGMEDNNQENMRQAKSMHGAGIAGVAERLSTVIQAVAQAALGESSAMANETLQRMRDSTNAVVGKEILRQAASIKDQNSALEKAIKDLGDYGKITETATAITREGMGAIGENLKTLKALAEGVGQKVQDAYAVNSKAYEEVAEEAAEKTEEGSSASPFFKRAS